MNPPPTEINYFSIHGYFILSNFFLDTPLFCSRCPPPFFCSRCPPPFFVLDAPPPFFFVLDAPPPFFCSRCPFWSDLTLELGLPAGVGLVVAVPGLACPLGAALPKRLCVLDLPEGFQGIIPGLNPVHYLLTEEGPG